MGKKMFDNSLCSGLFGKTRQAVLSLLFGHIGSSFYTKQVLDTVKIGRGTVQRELKNLTDAGIIIREVQGRQVYYRANEKCPIFHELKNIVRKTFGVAYVLRQSLAPEVLSRPASAVGEASPQYLASKPSAISFRRLVVPRRKLASFCRRNHIMKLSLFGSVLRDDFRRDSDIDVLAQFEQEHTPGFFKLANMEEELHKLFGRKIDLRTPQDLSRYFRDRVLKEAEVLYSAA